ncbi:hypothetical protein FGO68_gene2620 [Halteria grandinella]|uniref:Uncharacterized protein n=1 Tax=Halteria grandinella TaxID=5974 RepID=A0A8J8SXM8_HALGN|nr:hypothetical protein FGO68_gene2620 [Halteria grandinella]
MNINHQKNVNKREKQFRMADLYFKIEVKEGQLNVAIQIQSFNTEITVSNSFPLITKSSKFTLTFSI